MVLPSSSEQVSNIDQQSTNNNILTNNNEVLPSSPNEMWFSTLSLAQEITEIVKDGIEEDVGLVYEALDQTFKWNERRREKVENSNSELNSLNRQIEAKREALEKLKSNSNSGEHQAEIYRLEQESYEEARKVKELDNQLGSIKAQITKSQLESQELEKYDPIRSNDLTISSDLFKVKLFHEMGFVKLIRDPKQNNSLEPEKLLIRCDRNPNLSRVVQKPESNKDGYILANQIWEVISSSS